MTKGNDMNDPALRIVAAKNQIATELDGETVILHLGTGVYFSMNELGSRIWRLLEQPRCLEELHATLLAEYTVEPAALQDDIDEFVSNLASHELIISASETDEAAN